MRVVYTPVHLLHDPRLEVASGRPIPMYESTARAERIREALVADGGFSFEDPTDHGSGPIVAVHAARMLRYLETAWSEWRRSGPAEPAIVPGTIDHPHLREGMGPTPEPESPLGRIGYWCFDTATPLVQGTYEAARGAVDVALTAADAVLDGGAAAYGLCRPPGHHAARAMFGGYCYFNNAAIVAESMARRGGEPVAILDVDFHHGNGTQQIFWERGDVLYASIHGDPLHAYPYFAGHADETGGGDGAGATFNQPLPRGTDDAAYLEALDRALDRIADHPGSILVVSLGIDTFGQDPIGFFGLTTRAYHEIGGRVAALGRQTVVLQEGGYYVPQLGENVRQFLRGLEGRPLDLSGNVFGDG